MNNKMIVLADCIGIEDENPKQLLDYISNMGKIIEIRAIAYKSLVSQSYYDNLYNYWHMYGKGKEDVLSNNNVATKTEFLNFINDHCEKLLLKYKLRESEFFDQGYYNEIMQYIESYYKLDPKLELMNERQKIKAKL